MVGDGRWAQGKLTTYTYRVYMAESRSKLSPKVDWAKGANVDHAVDFPPSIPEPHVEHNTSEAIIYESTPRPFAPRTAK